MQIAKIAARGFVSRSAGCLALLVALVIPGAGTAHATADPNALWRIVGSECVPDQLQHGDPAPCARVDLDGGSAVLKDLVGDNQFLLIPTTRITGIESPELLVSDTPNYFAAAWHTREFVDERAGWTLPRDWVSLAINSAFARSQTQLHIHVDCVRADVRDELRKALSQNQVGSTWAPFPVPLAGRPYDAIAIGGDDLDVSPFALLADGVPGARTTMAERTLVVVGADGPDGRPGFIVLAGRTDPAAGDLAEGEELQDHASCPAPP